MLRLLLVCQAFLCLCCIGAMAEEKSTPPKDGLLPPAAHRPQPDNPPKTIYGTDDRIDLFQETDPARRALAASVCALMETTQVVEQTDGSFTVETFPFTISGTEPCSGEPFASQPVAAFCTGFMVGPDLIATAGHCTYSFWDDEITDLVFVFGFAMTDAATPVTQFTADQVYHGVEKVAEVYDYGADFAIVRTDRPIVAPGAASLPIRRAGTVPEGTLLGVIGHPSGLPLKLSFGAETTVRDNTPEEYFIANLDTFGGNSGSPVFNAGTGVVEGILVRGLGDFEFDRSCFRSLVYANEEAAEESTKATEFAAILFDPRGQLALDKLAYLCEDTVQIHLADADLEGAPGVEVLAFTSLGDLESLPLAPDAAGGFRFSGSISVGPGAVAPQDGVLQAVEGEALVFLYVDADNGEGVTKPVQASAVVDCAAPVISNVTVEPLGSMRALVRFETSEGAFGAVDAGTECGVNTIHASGDLGKEHAIEVSGLTPSTPYLLEISALDPAGNAATSDNDGACFPFTSGDFLDRFTETFFNLVSDMPGKSVLFTPDGAGYTACLSDASTFPSEACGQPVWLRDDNFCQHRLRPGHEFPFFGVKYDSFYLGSNGYITFHSGDINYYPDLNSHFSQPRISMYYSDLVPRDGGKTLLNETNDRVVVTFDDVADWWGDTHSFQAELFYDGRIRLTWLKLTRPSGIIGLSSGAPMAADFEESNLSAYPACADAPEGAQGGPLCLKGFLACGAAPAGAGPAVPGDLAALSVLLGGLLIYWRRRKTS